MGEVKVQIEENYIVNQMKGRCGKNASSDAFIRMFTNIVAENEYPEVCIYNAQHFIKSVVKKEILEQLDNQIDKFKTFLR